MGFFADSFCTGAFEIAKNIRTVRGFQWIGLAYILVTKHIQMSDAMHFVIQARKKVLLKSKKNYSILMDINFNLQHSLNKTVVF